MQPQNLATTRNLVRVVAEIKLNVIKMSVPLNLACLQNRVLSVPNLGWLPGRIFFGIPHPNERFTHESCTSARAKRRMSFQDIESAKLGTTNEILISQDAEEHFQILNARS